MKFPIGLKFYHVSAQGNISSYEIVDICVAYSYLYHIEVHSKAKYKVFKNEVSIESMMKKALKNTESWFIDENLALENALCKLQRRANKLKDQILKINKKL